MDKMIEQLKRVASQRTLNDQGVSSEDMYSWTTYEVFEAGREEGGIILARQLLRDAGIDWHA